MVKIEQLVKTYGEKCALDALNLNIPAGKIFGLLGPNGAGKTTLVSILNGLSGYDSGHIEIFGLSLHEELSEIRRRSALIPQTLAFYEHLSVMENLEFFAGMTGFARSERRKNIEHAIAVNRLESLTSQKAQTLSGGQKRRLNIAIGLLNDPDILYFDEPTVGIDPESRNEILETIKGFKEANKTVVYTSHYMPEIEKICDEVAIINRGQIIKHGTLEEMLRSEDEESVVAEIYETPSGRLNNVAAALKEVRIVNESTLLLEQNAPQDVARLLELLAAEGIKIKQLRYGTSTLESLFISLTSDGRHD